MKYWSVIWLTAGRLPEPAKDQTLLTRTPRVQWPGCRSATTEGPTLTLPWPRRLLVAVGKAQAGPTPQMSLPGLAGERKKVGLMSPKPNSPPVY